MIPQPIPPAASSDEICALAERWQIDPQLSVRLHLLAKILPFSIKIFSGYRSPEKQRELIADPDSTAAPVDLSNHTICPARAADLRIYGDGIVDGDVDDTTKLKFGRAAESVGLRWGGGARRVNGIPVGNEWRHVDLGPRP